MRGWDVPGYTEVKVRGSGGFGDALARHDQAGTLVAVKYLSPALVADPGFANMFREEARVLASLETPHVVRLYEYVESPSGAAVVTELVEGVSLRAIFSAVGRMPAQAALVVLNDSLLGLSAAHARGVVHRDYNPENVLVNGGGTTKLTNFGVAARASGRPIPAGTLPYTPPEQLGGGPASPAGDVYAATVTFYECVAGRPPFTGDTLQVLLRHQSEPVPMDPVPERLRPLVAAGMAKAPWDRPANAASFVAELREAAEAAFGQGWEDRGRSYLGEAASRLAAVWPADGTSSGREQAGPIEHPDPTHVKYMAGAGPAEAASGTTAADAGARSAGSPAVDVSQPKALRAQRLVRTASRSKYLPRWVRDSLPRDPSPGSAVRVVAGAAVAVLIVVAVIAVLAATLT